MHTCRKLSISLTRPSLHESAIYETTHAPAISTRTFLDQKYISAIPINISATLNPAQIPVAPIPREKHK
jgi:hypothetical protein